MKKIGSTSIIVLLVLGALLLMLRRFGGDLKQQAVSPGSSTVAEVRSNTIASATDANIVSVRLYQVFFTLGTTVFDASTYGGTIRLAWQDQAHLIVHVEHPDQLQIHRQARSWKGISIAYQSE